ncbi:MAG TPA: hypothetical protein VEW03_10535 [Longimicrobiaceae bacterium]|nr:hypothetical protein [Longimicrobiaceae bacterium]
MDCRLLGCVVLAVTAACERSEPESAPHDAPAPLTGTWALELRLERPPQLLVDTAAVWPVRGEVVLLPESGRASETPHRATHYGSHTVDVRPFGISLRGRGRVPTAVAWPAADSVQLTLDPDAPGGGLSLAGRLAGDSAAGRWWWHGPGQGSAGASGRFVLRRRR